ncbi:MAG: FeoB-associated Cys-rich membrane protein [Clostridia bacterium]|nr:FeoB-associated Cys-rich membrane protein [Clostridia bacterium]
MKDIIVALVIIIILACSIGYVIKAKKNGVKCIGCPSGKNCTNKGNVANCCGCTNCDRQ